MTSEKGVKRDKNQNIQVFVRLRPLNQRERDIKSLGVVEVVNNREVVVRQSQQTSLTKKFTFDRAFAPHAKQVEVYQDVVSPLIDEVLAGYNCTVFAYGQTGTGKTHTMVGESSGSDTTWQNDPLAGIIPRALSQLFDELRITNTEYTVRVSYLELYNEELFDLLSTSEDNSKLRIYEDVTRKGSNIVNGLEEITVYNKNEVYKIMEQGQERKRVASTLMNAQSSRSHTVFTIVVHMKENSPEGEELVKIGKLNLVDLAGSENISKAGSDNPSKRERARECVNINQSLLTLGRVITALVERHPHIPYRESKLTRILQESLGGRTKTSIIATISPGHKDLEETMSTLEYAHRAKNIQNKPEINQKLTKKAILKEFVEEIDKLKRDLQAARDKNGVYLASDTFTEMTLKQEEQRKEIQELLLKKRAMEEEKERMESIFKELGAALQAATQDLRHTENRLQSTQAKLHDTTNMLNDTRWQCEEQQHLVSKHMATERSLSAQAQLLLATVDTATRHVANLHDNVDKRRSVESRNLQVTETYREQANQHRGLVAAGTSQFSDSTSTLFSALQHSIDNYTSSSYAMHKQNLHQLEETRQCIQRAADEQNSMVSSKYTQLSEATMARSKEISSALDVHHRGVESALNELLGEVCVCVQKARDIDLTANVKKFIDQWYTDAVARVSSLQKAHSQYSCARASSHNARLSALRTHRDHRRTRAEDRHRLIQHCIHETEKEKSYIEQRTDQLFKGVETHKQETLQRIQTMEELLEREKQVLNRLSEEIRQLEEEKMYLLQQVDARKEWLEKQLEASAEEIELADRDLEESEIGAQDSDRVAKKFDTEFDQGTSAISFDLGTLSHTVVHVVDHSRTQLVAAVDTTQTLLQKQSSELISTDGQLVKQLSESNDALLTQLLDTTKDTLHAIMQHVQTTNSTTCQNLDQLTTSTNTLESAALSHQTNSLLGLDDMKELVSQFVDNIREATQMQAQLEERCLKEEYRLYSPTGKTPRRMQYQYPRTLVATSPHEKVLARLRAARQQQCDDDCIVVECNGERRPGSDSESSTSEELFAVPASSPTVISVTAHPLQKTVSETDIYSIRKRQETGKENANRSLERSTNKKPSKLPAPLSHKKPLVERVDN